MAHDVFISYSSKDKPTADAACAVLEGKGIRSWIAPRDITPGADWGEAIIDGINGARVFVLIFSSNANASQQIKREVERAVNHGLPIIPLRIEDVQPGKSLEYFLSMPHWLNAFTPPLEQHLNYLADVIRHILDGKPPPAQTTTAHASSMSLSAAATIYGFDRRLVLGAGALALVAVALGIGQLFGGGPPTFTGKWKASKVTVQPGASNIAGLSYATDMFAKPALEGPNIQGTLEVTDLGQYHYRSTAEDTGTVVADGKDGLKFTSDISHVTTRVSYFLLEPQYASSMVQAYGGNAGDMGLTIDPPFPMVQATLVGMPLARGFGAGVDRVAGTWRFRAVGNPMLQGTQVTLEISGDGHYRFKGELDENGMMTAADGKWTRTPQNGQPISGTYVFDGRDRVTAAAATGTTVWERTE
jgi:hypothetical protein